MDNTEVFEKKRLAFLGLIMGFSLSSYYYFFVIEFLVLLFFLIYKFKLKFIKELLDNYRNILILIIVFLIAISPFIINLIYHESDVTERMGLFVLTTEKKGKLINYYFGCQIRILRSPSTPRASLLEEFFLLFTSFVFFCIFHFVDICLG